MAEELQGLLEKIKRDGFDKVEEERKKILDTSKKEAEEIVSKAKEKADEILKQAKLNADLEKQRGEAILKQAARDISISLKDDIIKKLNNLVKNLASETMTPEFMAKLISQMASAYISSSDYAQTKLAVEAMLSQNDLEKMTQLLGGSLIKNLKDKPELHLASDISGGIKIGFKGSDVFYDFTDDAIADLICSYAGPKFTALLQSDKK